MILALLPQVCFVIQDSDCNQCRQSLNDVIMTYLFFFIILLCSICFPARRERSVAPHLENLQYLPTLGSDALGTGVPYLAGAPNTNSVPFQKHTSVSCPGQHAQAMLWGMASGLRAEELSRQVGPLLH